MDPQVQPATPQPGNQIKQNNPWAKIVLMIVGVLILAGGVYGYTSHLSKIKTQEIQESSTTTSTWQTYRNEEYGFEIKLPKAWSILERGNVIVFFTNTKQVDQIGGIIIDDMKNEKVIDIPEWLTAWYEAIRIDNLTIGTNKFMRWQDGHETSADDWTYSMLLPNKYLINISIYSSEADQILSTLRFTQQKALLPDVLPLYTGAQWSDPETIEENYHDYTKNKDLILKGTKVMGATRNDEYINFQKHYNIKLNSSGWEQDLNKAADGPSGSIWGYKKGNNRIIFEWNKNNQINTFYITTGVI